MSCSEPKYYFKESTDGSLSVELAFPTSNMCFSNPDFPWSLKCDVTITINYVMDILITLDK